jgi:hypothetical protein
MHRYVDPLLKGRKEKEKPPAKLNKDGKLDFSENFAMKLHTRREDDDYQKPITSKKLK